jgi:hypothetical protein
MNQFHRQFPEIDAVDLASVLCLFRSPQAGGGEAPKVGVCIYDTLLLPREAPGVVPCWSRGCASFSSCRRFQAHRCGMKCRFTLLLERKGAHVLRVLRAEPCSPITRSAPFSRRTVPGSLLGSLRRAFSVPLRVSRRDTPDHSYRSARGSFPMSVSMRSGSRSSSSDTLSGRDSEKLPDCKSWTTK